jgi:hypothetical protein
MIWGKSYYFWLVNSSVMGITVKTSLNSFIVSKRYDRYINKFKWNSPRAKKNGRKKLNSIRSDIIEAGLKEKRFSDLTDNWFWNRVKNKI